MTIEDELAALRRERPKPDTTLADALVDVIESILSADAGLSVPEAVDRALPWLWLPIMVAGVVYLAIANGVR